LILSGSGGYTGGTDVIGGTLDLASATALPGGSRLTVGNAAAFGFDTSAAASDAATMPTVPGLPVRATLAAVPEPGTLALLSAAGIVLAATAWRRRRIQGIETDAA